MGFRGELVTAILMAMPERPGALVLVTMVDRLRRPVLKPAGEGGRPAGRDGTRRLEGVSEGSLHAGVVASDGSVWLDVLLMLLRWLAIPKSGSDIVLPADRMDAEPATPTGTEAEMSSGGSWDTSHAWLTNSEGGDEPRSVGELDCVLCALTLLSGRCALASTATEADGVTVTGALPDSEGERLRPAADNGEACATAGDGGREKARVACLELVPTAAALADTGEARGCRVGRDRCVPAARYTTLGEVASAPDMERTRNRGDGVELPRPLPTDRNRVSSCGTPICPVLNRRARARPWLPPLAVSMVVLLSLELGACRDGGVEPRVPWWERPTFWKLWLRTNWGDSLLGLNWRYLRATPTHVMCIVPLESAKLHIPGRCQRTKPARWWRQKGKRHVEAVRNNSMSYTAGPRKRLRDGSPRSPVVPVNGAHGKRRSAYGMWTSPTQRKEAATELERNGILARATPHPQEITSIKPCRNTHHHQLPPLPRQT